MVPRKSAGKILVFVVSYQVPGKYVSICIGGDKTYQVPGTNAPSGCQGVKIVLIFVF